jgi:hypothetical protein
MGRESKGGKETARKTGARGPTKKAKSKGRGRLYPDIVYALVVARHPLWEDGWI